MSDTIEVRYPTARVRQLRETLKFTKAETARRAQLTPSQYAWFESKGVRLRVNHIPKSWVERVAIALGTTTEYIATGKTNAQPLPPRHPLRAMTVVFEKERAKLEREIRRHEKNRKKLEQLVESTANELKVVRQMGDAALAMRMDDAEYLREIAKSFLGADTRNDAFALEDLREAAERIARGEPARPEPQRGHGEDLQAQRERDEERQ